MCFDLVQFHMWWASTPRRHSSISEYPLECPLGESGHGKSPSFSPHTFLLTLKVIQNQYFISLNIHSYTQSQSKPPINLKVTSKRKSNEVSPRILLEADSRILGSPDNLTPNCLVYSSTTQVWCKKSEWKYLKGAYTWVGVGFELWWDMGG